VNVEPINNNIGTIASTHISVESKNTTY